MPNAFSQLPSDFELPLRHRLDPQLQLHRPVRERVDAVHVQRREDEHSVIRVALHLGAAFIQSLQAQQDALAYHGVRDADYYIPYSTIHAGMMRGGTALNIVPNRCEIDFEIRNIAEDDPVDILSGIAADAEAIAAPYRNRFPMACIEIEEVSGYPGLATRPDAAVVRLLARLLGDDTTLKVAFGTEGGLFDEALGLSTAVCGPGSMEQGHKPDEFVSRTQLDRCDAMLARLSAELETTG